MMMVFESSYKKCRVSHFSAVPFSKGEEHSGGVKIKPATFSFMRAAGFYIVLLDACHF